MALPTASDNAFSSLLVTEGSAPASPASGKQRLFIDSADHALKLKNSSGTVAPIGGLPVFHGAKAYDDALQTFGATTVTPIVFAHESFDTDGYHDTGSNTNRMTIPAGLAGYYRLTGFLHFNTTSGDIFAFFQDDAGVRLHNEAGSAYVSAASNDLTVVTTVYLAEADWVEFCGYHSQASNQTVGSTSIISQYSTFAIEFLGA